MMTTASHPNTLSNHLFINFPMIFLSLHMISIRMIRNFFKRDLREDFFPAKTVGSFFVFFIHRECTFVFLRITEKTVLNSRIRHHSIEGNIIFRNSYATSRFFPISGNSFQSKLGDALISIIR